jgi:hypothetical protein
VNIKRLGYSAAVVAALALPWATGTYGLLRRVQQVQAQISSEIVQDRLASSKRTAAYWASRSAPITPPSPDYDPINEIVYSKYEAHVKEFVDFKNPAQTAALKAKIDEEENEPWPSHSEDAYGALGALFSLAPLFRDILIGFVGGFVAIVYGRLAIARWAAWVNG